MDSTKYVNFIYLTYQGDILIYQGEVCAQCGVPV